MDVGCISSSQSTLLNPAPHLVVSTTRRRRFGAATTARLLLTFEPVGFASHLLLINRSYATLRRRRRDDRELEFLAVDRLVVDRAMKTYSRKLASSVSVSQAPLKRHVPVSSTLKSGKGSVAKSPSTSSSDSSSGKTSLNGGKAVSNRKTAQGISKDDPADVEVSLESQSSAESFGTGFEASNDLSSECVEPVETKHTIDNVAEKSLSNSDKLQPTGLDVVHSNLAVSWFNVDDHEFNIDFLKTKADEDPQTTGSEKQQLLIAAGLEATATPYSLLESINNAYIDEFEGAIGRAYSISTPLLEEKCEVDKVIVDVEEFRHDAPDMRDCSETMDSCHKHSLDLPAAPEASEGKSKLKLASENLMRVRVRGSLDSFRGWGAKEILLSAFLVVLLTVLFCVDKFTKDEFSMLPPPT